MNSRIAGTVLGLGLVVAGLTGCGQQDSVAAPGTPTPTVSQPTTQPATPSPAPEAPDHLVAPGAVGPIQVGMSKAEWEASGAFVRDTRREKICEGVFYRWKDDRLHRAADVLHDPAGTIVSLGVNGPGPRTAEGIGIGSTYAEVKAAYGERLSGLASNDYGSGGVFVQDGDAWIGFMFDAETADVTDAAEVGFMEVSRGLRPGLLRDGC